MTCNDKSNQINTLNNVLKADQDQLNLLQRAGVNPRITAAMNDNIKMVQAEINALQSTSCTTPPNPVRPSGVIYG